MKRTFRTSFLRDLKKIKEKKLLERIEAALDNVASAQALKDVLDLEKMRGPDDYFRIRVGDYRIGIKLAEDVVEFLRCLPRNKIYRKFP